MKQCPYCGADNDDIISDCRVCATSLSPEESGSLAEVWRWQPGSAFARSIAVGVGVVLVCTAVFVVVGLITAIAMDALAARGLMRTAPFVDEEISGGLKLNFFGYSQPVFAMLSIAFAWYMVKERCDSKAHQVVATALTSITLALLIAAPLFWSGLMYAWLLLPVGFLGLLQGSSLGLAFGILLQLVVGSWLLGWFKRRKKLNAHRA